MRIILVFLLLLLGGCATLGGSNPQPVNTIMGVLAAASSYSVNGCIPPINTADPNTACAPVTSTDSSVINAAFQACLHATVAQVVVANLHIPRCQTAAVPATVAVPAK